MNSLELSGDLIEDCIRYHHQIGQPFRVDFAKFDLAHHMIQKKDDLAPIRSAMAAGQIYLAEGDYGNAVLEIMDLALLRDGKAHWAFRTLAKFLVPRGFDIPDDVDLWRKMISVEFCVIVIDEIQRDFVNDAQLYDKYVRDYENRDFKAELTAIMG